MQTTMQTIEFPGTTAPTVVYTAEERYKLSQDDGFQGRVHMLAIRLAFKALQHPKISDIARVEFEEILRYPDQVRLKLPSVVAALLPEKAYVTDDIITQTLRSLWKQNLLHLGDKKDD